MAAEPDRVFTRQHLLAELHGFDQYVSGRTIDVHVMNLRKKIEPDPARPDRLLTVFGVGYKLTDPAKGIRVVVTSSTSVMSVTSVTSVPTGPPGRAGCRFAGACSGGC